MGIKSLRKKIQKNQNFGETQYQNLCEIDFLKLITIDQFVDNLVDENKSCKQSGCSTMGTNLPLWIVI